jgi:hypothetical protein
MLTNKQLNDAFDYGEWLRQIVHDLELPDNNRVRAAGSCLAIAKDHHHAIVVLLEERLYASSFALLRIEFEAYIRGQWLALCANDNEIQNFLNGYEKPKDRPEIKCIIKKLESTPAFTEQQLSCLKERAWTSLCSYTHTDGLHVQLWNTAEAIEPNYSDEELVEVLRFADIIATLSVLGTVNLMKDEKLAQELGQSALDRFMKRLKE